MNDRALWACTFWGVRGSTPCADKQCMEFGGNTTCVQIHLPDSDEVLIFDSGTGIRNVGQQLEKQDRNLRGRIFITHPHWDHIQGFPFFQPVHDPANRFAIHMPVQQEGSCKEIMLGHFSKTFFPVAMDMLDAELIFMTQPRGLVSYRDYHIEFMKANHSVNTAIYKLHVDGRQLVFAPDNELVPGKYGDNSQMEQIAKFIRGADALIHDAQYDLAAYEDRQGWGHSAWEEVVKVARREKVRKLFLTHHDPGADDHKLQRLDEHLQEDYGSLFEVIKLAKEGQTEVI